MYNTISTKLLFSNSIQKKEVVDCCLRCRFIPTFINFTQKYTSLRIYFINKNCKTSKKEFSIFKCKTKSKTSTKIHLGAKNDKTFWNYNKVKK